MSSTSRVPERDVLPLRVDLLRTWAASVVEVVPGVPPATSPPSCTSHGQTWSGAASIVTAIVAPRLHRGQGRHRDTARNFLIGRAPAHQPRTYPGAVRDGGSGPRERSWSIGRPCGERRRHRTRLTRGQRPPGPRRTARPPNGRPSIRRRRLEGGEGGGSWLEVVERRSELEHRDGAGREPGLQVPPRSASPSPSSRAKASSPTDGLCPTTTRVRTSSGVSASAASTAPRCSRRCGRRRPTRGPGAARPPPAPRSAGRAAPARRRCDRAGGLRGPARIRRRRPCGRPARSADGPGRPAHRRPGRDGSAGVGAAAPVESRTC